MSEWLIHPLLQTARGYLTDEDHIAVEATLQEAVERAKDTESEVQRLRNELADIAVRFQSHASGRAARAALQRNSICGGQRAALPSRETRLASETDQPKETS